jgi:hypothetical protein
MATIKYPVASTKTITPTMCVFVIVAWKLEAVAVRRNKAGGVEAEGARDG